MTKVTLGHVRFTVDFRSLLTTVVLTFVGCDMAIREAAREAQPLTYVGQLEFGVPVKQEGKLFVPIAYRGGQWAENSAVVPVSIVSKLEGNEIEITVITSVASRRVDGGYEMAIPSGAKGRYTVYYRDPDSTRREIGCIDVVE